MTTNEPFAPEPTDPTRSTEQPWGSAPSTPPAGSGSDHTATGPTFANTPAGPSTVPGAQFFDRIRTFGITRPDPGQGRVLAGVAAGIARRYSIDPIVVRIAFVILTLVGGLGVTLYGLGWLFLPHPDGRIHAQQVLTGTVTAGFVGALATVVLTVHDALPLIVIALIVWAIVRHRRTNQAHAA
jgi:phage shock protein PspC (stress-responsive transcriptional regulator)